MSHSDALRSFLDFHPALSRCRGFGLMPYINQLSAPVGTPALSESSGSDQTSFPVRRENLSSNPDGGPITRTLALILRPNVAFVATRVRIPRLSVQSGLPKPPHC